LGIQSKHLTVLSLNNDPFYAGRPAQKRDAEWFAGLWNQLQLPAGIHLRKIHYKLVSGSTPIMLPSSGAYENRERHWEILGAAAKYARHLDLVSPDQFSDHRNPDPLLFALYPDEVDDEPDWELEGDVSAWHLPSLQTRKMLLTDASLALPTIKTNGYEYSLRDQPYYLECWIEKSTMDDVLVPICRQFHVNLAPGIGYTSITQLINLLKRIQSLPDDRPSRIFYVSDFDGAGDGMPVQASRHLEYYIDQYAGGRDIKLTPIALTADQVRHYQLPCIPTKETDRSAKGFKERRGVEGQTELDALEAIYPGELARLISETIGPYRDESLPERMEEAAREAQETADDQLAEHLQEEASQVEELQQQIDAIVEEFKPGIAELNRRHAAEQEELIAELHARLAPLQESLQSLQEQVTSSVTNLRIELPDRPEANVNPGDESGFLYASDRDYTEQLKAYKSHQNKATIDDLEKICTACGAAFHSRRSDASMCSEKCRMAAYRERKRLEAKQN
jgi:hypothetical protein